MTVPSADEHGDDMALVAELIQKVLRRLDPLDGVERIASKDEVLDLASKLAGVQVALSKGQIEALLETARIGALDGAKAASDHHLHQVRALLDQRHNEQVRLLNRLDLVATESEAQTALIRRWKWWALGGVGLIGALLGGLLVALAVIRGEALDFRDNMRSSMLFDLSCKNSGGQTGTNGEAGRDYCVFWKPE